MASAIVGGVNVGVDVGGANAAATCAGQGLTGTLTLVQVNSITMGAVDVNFNIWFEA